MLANVISIKNSSRRLEAKKRGNQFGFNVCFFDASDYVKKSISDLSNEFDIEKFNERYGRNPASGEIGVFMCHFRLWEKLSKDLTQDYHLILEDDFLPQATAKEIDEIINCTKNKYDVIILGYSKVDSQLEDAISIINPIKAKYFSGPHKLGRKFHESTCGALSYVVQDSFFDKVIVNAEKPSYLIDDWSIFKKMGVKILHVSPLCFYEDYKNMSSNIDQSGRFSPDYSKIKKRNSVYKVLRYIYRRSIGLLLTVLMFLGVYSSS